MGIRIRLAAALAALLAGTATVAAHVPRWEPRLARGIHAHAARVVEAARAPVIDAHAAGEARATLAPPVVNVQEVNPGTSVERDLCVTVSVAAGAAAECGDLRLAHALPSMRNLNQVRAPVLLYNSQHASPYAVVAANVSLPQGTSGLSRVTAVLRVNGAPRGEGIWRGSAWPQGTGATRIAVGFDASSEPTGPYRYTLEVRAYYGATYGTTTVTGTLVVVNRAASPFGAGWWLAGLEQLVLDPSGYPALWVGGDGSTRRYVAVQGDSVWAVVPAVDRPDTLRRTSTGWVRLLPGKVRVLFDTQGRHVGTTGRLGQTTTFSYDTAGRVDGIHPPLTALQYTFVYGPGGRLSRVESPDTSAATARITRLYGTGARVDSIVDPDQARVGFGYPGATSALVTSRTDPLNVATAFRYDTARRVVASRLDLAGGDSIVMRVRSIESLGLAAADGTGAVDTARAYVRIDGPRTDVGDTTLVWVDRWGAPRKVRDPLGAVTLAWKADARFPAVVTRTQAPNGLASRLVVNARGTIDSMVVENPLGDGRDAKTAYSYGDPAWPDFVTQVRAPGGEVTQIGYDANGNRAWQQDGRGTASRVVFRYTSFGEVASVQAPLQPRADTLLYDAAGNLHATRTAIGYWTLAYADRTGRDTLVITPVDSAAVALDTTALQQEGSRQRTTYDVMGRALLTQSTGPQTSYERLHDGGYIWQSPQVLTVRNRYDARGQLVRTDRWATPDDAHLDTLTTRWRYDRAGRKVAEIAPGAPGAAEARDSTVYNPAGLPVRSINRLGYTIDLAYDAAGRLLARTIPATGVIAGEVEQYTYDEMGNIRSATNSAAVVTRGYSRTGALLADTTHLARDNGTFDTAHVYVTGYQYDLAGRRTGMTVPLQVAPSITQRQFTYQYDTITGALRTVTEPMGSIVAFRQRLDGALDTLRVGVVDETYHYDADGRMTRRVRGGWYDDSLRLSPRGKTLVAITRRDSTRMAYDGLGHTVHSATYDWHSTSSNQHEEEYTFDALGNTLTHRRIGYSLNGSAASQDPDPTVYGYQRWTGRHMSSIYAPDTRAYLPYGARDDVINQWDPAGNLTARWDSNSVKLVQGATIGSPGNTSPAVDDGTDNTSAVQGSVAGYRYRADGKTMEVVRSAGCVLWINPFDHTAVCTTQVPEYTRQTRTERYRYDALGRRVYVRTETAVGGWGGCLWRCDNTVRRTLWDGDQVLAEIRYPTDVPDQDVGMDPANVAAMAQRAAVDSTANGNPYGGPNTSDWAQSGRVLYVHAGGVDQPLALIRMDYSMDFPEPTLVVPHADWRGTYEMGTFVFGDQTHCKQVYLPASEVVQQDSSGHMVYPFENDDGSDATQQRCMEIDFPGKYMTMTRLVARQRASGPVSWMGSLAQDNQDASGLMYRRNRMYDPTSGRFTQEDPIGLAGGINAYGFAEGDPVSYSDPYGLDVRPRDRQAMIIINRLIRYSPTFRRIFHELNQDHGIVISVENAERSTHPLAFAALTEKGGWGYHTDAYIWGGGKGTVFHHAGSTPGDEIGTTDEARMGHEFVHAAATFRKAEVPRACVSDKSQCIVDMENQIRDELRQNMPGARNMKPRESYDQP